jgi:hypothetical protein
MDNISAQKARSYVGVSISAATGDSIHCMLVVGKWLPFWVEQSSHNSIPHNPEGKFSTRIDEQLTFY